MYRHAKSIEDKLAYLKNPFGFETECKYYDANGDSVRELIRDLLNMEIPEKITTEIEVLNLYRQLEDIYAKNEKLVYFPRPKNMYLVREFTVSSDEFEIPIDHFDAVSEMTIVSGADSAVLLLAGKKEIPFESVPGTTKKKLDGILPLKLSDYVTRPKIKVKRLSDDVPVTFQAKYICVPDQSYRIGSYDVLIGDKIVLFQNNMCGVIGKAYLP